MSEIRIGILGYGNLGRGVELAIRQNADMRLVALFTRRDPSSLTPLTEGVPVYSADSLPEHTADIDVLVLCGGRNNGIVEGRKTSKEEVGLLMTKLREPQEKGGVA